MQPFLTWSIDGMAARPSSRRRLGAGAQGLFPPHVDGMAMGIGLTRSELTGLADRGGDGFSARPRKSAVETFRSGYVWLPVVVIAFVGTWALLSGFAGDRAESEPANPLTAVVTEPPPSSAIDAASKQTAFEPAATDTIAEPVPVEGLKISSQSWRRGGLGSKALVTLTLRNGNDYAVKDIEITCAFSRRDGSHLTDRTRVIHDTVNMKSRRIFSRMLVGFVNVNANAAKCALVAASRA